MRSAIVFTVITLYLLVGIHGYQGEDFDPDQAIFYRARKFPRVGAREWLSSDIRAKTQEALDNPLLLEECQSICADLRAMSIDESGRETYKQCRNKCVQDGLAAERKRKSV